MRDVTSLQKLIMTAARYSAAAYDYANDIKRAQWYIAERRLENITKHKNENAACFIGVDKKEHDPTLIWVAFCGTNELADWSDNLSRATVPLRAGHYGGVHVGFLHQFRLLTSAINIQLHKLKQEHTDIEIVFTGHSLGSALATIAAVHYAHLGYKCQAIGFATPRVFDRKAALYVDHASQALITRVEIPTDWVCDVPPRNGKSGYCHVGKGIWIDYYGYVYTEDRPQRHKVFAWMKRITRRMYAWKVHQMREYIRRLMLWYE